MPQVGGATWIVGGIAGGLIAFALLELFGLAFGSATAGGEDLIIRNEWVLMTDVMLGRYVTIGIAVIATLAVTHAIVSGQGSDLTTRLLQGAMAGLAVGAGGAFAAAFMFSPNMQLQLFRWFGSGIDSFEWAVRIAWATSWTIMAAGAAAFLAWLSNRRAFRAAGVGALAGAAASMATLEMSLSDSQVDADLWTLVHCVTIGLVIAGGVLAAPVIAATRAATSTALGWAAGSVAAVACIGIVVASTSNADAGFNAGGYPVSAYPESGSYEDSTYADPTYQEPTAGDASSSGGSSSGGSSSGGSSGSDRRPATRQETRSTLRALESVLEESAVGRLQIIASVRDLCGAVTPADAYNTVAGVITNRQQVLRRLDALKTETHADIRHLVTLLDEAINISLQSNYAYRDWFASYTCGTDRSLNPHYQTAAGLSDDATAAKQAFAAQYNPTAARLGMRQWSDDEF